MNYRQACNVLEASIQQVDCQSPNIPDIAGLIKAISVVAEAFNEQELARDACADLNRPSPCISDNVRKCVQTLHAHAERSPGMERHLAMKRRRAESRNIVVAFSIVATALLLYAGRLIYLHGISAGQGKTLLFWSLIPMLPLLMLFFSKGKRKTDLEEFYRFQRQMLPEYRDMTFHAWLNSGDSGRGKASNAEMFAFCITLFLIIAVAVLHADY